MLTDDALAIWREGVAAVDAERLVGEQVRVEQTPAGEVLWIAEHPFPIADLGRLIVVGAGKASGAMAAGFEAAVGEGLAKQLRLEGWVNVPEGTERPLRWIHLDPVRPAGLNEPTPRAVEGSRKILELVGSAEANDLCVALFSGGGSALLPLPIDGITLEDKRQVTRFLSGAGADIEALNVVRKHLSAIKGGKLAAACRAGHLVTLVISDVLGDPLDLIASGPTVDDSSTTADALAVLARFDRHRELPESVYRVLENRSPVQHSAASRSVSLPERQVAIIGNNAVAVDGAGIEAERRGYSHAMTSARRSEGAAEEVGRHLAEMALSMLRDAPAASGTPDCLITGGEPVVQLVAAAERGRGGRNQQLVLAALERLMEEGESLTTADRERIVILSGGTDGEDGPTDAAGAYVDAAVWQRAVELGLDVADYLRRNDAYHFFERAGGLLKTGPTGTNVCDLRVVVVRRDARR
ncbi:glycerate kinase type-2 family protein [Candidatus Laterigemmans baculatus]|uniref:glycerate kinase type-2 family protein n=1 Tax=Candidatus Laterigemmans baculatus TaxID=2770505 RepID=UPI0013DD71E6|nr:DUF4147 domain-containing protein [Candidatus Laterigemmans baculatus]